MGFPLYLCTLKFDRVSWESVIHCSGVVWGACSSNCAFLKGLLEGGGGGRTHHFSIYWAAYLMPGAAFGKNAPFGTAEVDALPPPGLVLTCHLHDSSDTKFMPSSMTP